MNKNNMNAVPLNTRLLNTTKLNTIGFPVLSKRGGSSADISEAIMDSLVCWYDIGKQQCTNEGMASNPVLADLSGNGHDIECFNFAWSGMSGIGGYSNFKSNTQRANIEKLGEQHWLINSIYDTNPINKECILISRTEINTFIFGKTLKVRLSGNIKEGTLFSMSAYRVELKEGMNEIPIPTEDSEFSNFVYAIFSFPLETTNVEIEILPLYPNALVSDGVDDYCYTDGLPILTDYTVIAKRKWLADNISTNNNACIAVKGSGGMEHAFILERLDNSGNYMEYNFKAYNNITLYADEITYCTKHSYNGQSIIAGTSVDTDDLRLYGVSSGSDKAKAALYSFLLFDRTLTTAEIEWVKKNMIESGGVLATNWADSSLWAFYNEANQVRITGTLSSNRMTISSSGMANPDISVTSNFMECIIQNSMISAYKIKVTGLKNGIILYYLDNQAYNPIRLEMSEDGIYNIPEHNTQNR